MEERIVLNVGGQKFEVSTKTLSRYPQSVLGSLVIPGNESIYKPDKRGEYFFDRNPKFFDSILDLYRTGKFVVANDIPLELMREELKFWKLKIEGEEEEETEEEPAQPKTPEAAFNMAFALLQGRSRWEIREGIKILEELLQQEEHSKNLEYMYQVAFGYHRLSDGKKTVEKLKQILEIDPYFRSALSLQTLNRDKSSLHAKAGFLFVIFLSLGTIFLFKSAK